ncbi:hypothetical protein G9A89_004410 [Geosiphon pyriformis]|nr:hypothetical protein G9A89_004410 [Geosiphon pyriformis]
MQNTRDIDVYSWISLNIFLLVILFVVYPISVPIPFTDRPPFRPKKQSNKRNVQRNQSIKSDCKGYSIHLPLNLATAPILGSLILLATTCIDAQVVLNGFVGSEGIQPYSIMILFYALAYICISLDMTGFVEFCAYWFSNRSGSDGKKLFTYFFILFNIITAFTSNDVTILAGTTFLIYFTRLANINPPTAFLISEFQAANIASMLLYIGNPTNVVVAQAYDISFLKYSAWMTMPTIVSIVVAYIMLRIVFRRVKYIPDEVHTPKRPPREVLVSPKGAIFGCFVLAACIVTLMVTSFSGIQVWKVTLPFAVAMLIKDTFYDLWFDKKKRNYSKEQELETGNNKEGKEQPAEDLEAFEMKNTDNTIVSKDRKDRALSTSLSTSTTIATRSIGVNSDMNIESDPKRQSGVDTISSEKKEQLIDKIVTNSQTSDHESGNTLEIATAIPFEPTKSNEIPIFICETIESTAAPLIVRVSWFQQKLPTVYGVLIRMPGALLPFSLGMFVLVEALSSLGWIALFAKALSKITPSYIPAIFSMALISIILCNLLNNLPMTVLMTRVLQHSNFANASHVTPVIMKGCIFALIIGSNVGACFTVFGALAGIMWDKILKDKGIPITYWQFLRWNIYVMPLVVISSCAICQAVFVYLTKLPFTEDILRAFFSFLPLSTREYPWEKNMGPRKDMLSVIPKYSLNFVFKGTLVILGLFFLRNTILLVANGEVIKRRAVQKDNILGISEQQIHSRNIQGVIKRRQIFDEIPLLDGNDDNKNDDNNPLIQSPLITPLPGTVQDPNQNLVTIFISLTTFAYRAYCVGEKTSIDQNFQVSSNLEQGVLTFAFQSGSRRLENLRQWPFENNDLAPLTDFSAPYNAMVHGELYLQYQASKSTVDSLLGQSLDVPIFFAGEGLGAVYALFSFISFVMQRRQYLKSPITLITYGEPRVGNDVFAEWFNFWSRKYNAPVYRFRLELDRIANFPPRTYGYVHHATEYLLSSQVGNVYECDRRDPECAISNRITSLETIQYGGYFGIDVGKCIGKNLF